MPLQLEGIQKRFGGVVALRNGNLSVKAGEVHLLMGENGAGKSTLMKIVAGMFPADAGQMLWNGQPISFRNLQKHRLVGSPWSIRNACSRSI
jgi:ABC-type sugar transport system ATPase subunit